MVSSSLLYTLASVFQISIAGTIPSRSRPPVARAAAAPAIPTPTLISDFKKDNVSAQWAPGHPLQWGTEEKLIEFPIPLESYGSLSAALSDDEKFLILTNETFIKVISVADGSLVSTPTFNASEQQIESILLRTAPDGGYDLLVSTQQSYSNFKNFQIRISKDGISTGEPVERLGEFTTFETWYSGTGASPLSKDRRRFVTENGDRPGVAYIYDFEDASASVTLEGHTDRIMSAVFSPDGKTVATAGWDGYGKLWDATSGKLLHDLGPYKAQNWLARFSPDGNNILVSIGSRANVSIWDTRDLTKAPVVFGPFGGWVRTAAWSPKGDFLAIGGDSGLITIYRTSDWAVAQTWQMEDRSNEAFQLEWLDGGKKISYRIMGGLEMYDFETNLKYRWGPGDFDRFTGGGNTLIVKSKNWIGGVEADNTVKFWKYE